MATKEEIKAKIRELEMMLARSRGRGDIKAVLKLTRRIETQRKKL